MAYRNPCLWVVLVAVTAVAGARAWGQHEVVKLTASDAASFDAFGEFVANSGDFLIVGAPRNNTVGPTSGAAYIFARDQGGADNWGEVRILAPSDPFQDDGFGGSVAIDGDIAIVGAYGNDDAGSSSGSAYLFYRNEGGTDNWGQKKKLTASDAGAEDNFGRAVAISGDIVIVGAIGDDDGGFNAGAVYLFYRNQGGTNNWGQVAKRTAGDAAAEDFFGYGVAISGDTAIIGAPWDDDHGNRSGAAYIFRQNEGGTNNWGQVAKLTALDASEEDRFGEQVAIGGSLVIVSPDYSGKNRGAARPLLL